MKKELIYKDEDGIKKMLLSSKEAEAKLNELVKLVQNELKENLTNEEKFSLKEKGANFIKEKVKARFPFPDASEDFNLKALGLNIQPLLNYCNLNYNHWQQFNFGINEKGRFELDGEPEQISKFYHYAETPKQKEALAFAKNISKQINDAKEKGLINDRLLSSVRDLSDYLEIERISGTTDFIVAPNTHRLIRLK